MSEPVYDTDYFIAKFSAIPDIQWCEGRFQNENGQHCALGHCGMKNYSDWFDQPREARALNRLFENSPATHVGPGFLSVPEVNNNHCHERFTDNRNPYPQPTPKARILAALFDIKAKGMK